MTKLLFLATEDWFIRSHFLPLLRRARAEGYEVAVAARDSGALKDESVRVIDMPFARGSLKPGDLWREAAAMRTLMREVRPDLLHAIALKPIVLSMLTGGYGAARVFALTGRGYLSVSSSWLRWAAPAIAFGMRRAVRKTNTALMVENEADRVWVEGGARLPDARVTLMPGAGVDPARFTPRPAPEGPVIVGVASRLIWSKGIDLAVEAIRRLNAEGRDMRLHIAGDADGDNPEAVSAETLAQWRAIPGVSLLGRVDDIAAFWGGAHIACVPTRGGEGLPRTLLEAASCARPLIVSDTPGCADFVRNGVEGLVVTPNSAFALAEALGKLADDARLRQTWGENARARVLAGYTEQHAADAAAAAWRWLI
jgi:glycosyltransferase involved in cell wall biosynthesis